MHPARSRRAFLSEVAWGLGGSSLAAAIAPQPPDRESPVIDTHTHFYDPRRVQGVPWPPKEDTLLHRPVLPADYRRLSHAEGVVGTIVVEASPWLEDNQWLLELAERESIIVGIVGRLEPGEPDFPAQLRRFARHPLFRGIRVGSWTNGVRLDDSGVRSHLEALANHQLALDINGGADLLPAVEALAGRLPDLQIVVNHVGNVRIDGKAPPVAWSEGMRRLGMRRNVACKLSGLVEGTGAAAGGAPSTADFYQAVFDVVWEAFGPDRLIYGSNWPVSERFAAYRVVQQLALDCVRAKDRPAVRKVFHDNSQRVYRWGPRKS